WHNGASMPPPRTPSSNARKTPRRQSVKKDSGKRASGRKASGRKSSGNGFRVLKWLFVLGFWGALFAGLWAVWIGYQVRQQFESLQWALPGRIYARPLELFVGAHVARDDLVFYLERA